MRIYFTTARQVCHYQRITNFCTALIVILLYTAEKHTTDMKRRHILKSSALLTLAASITGCGAAYWESSSDYTSGGYPIYSGYYGNDWYPSLPASPGLLPVYWGGSTYPAPVPVYRPAYRPVPPVVNRPSGNNRPSLGGEPVPRPDNRPVIERPVVPPSGGIPPEQITGGEPGIVMPPPGTGFRPGRR